MPKRAEQASVRGRRRLGVAAAVVLVVAIAAITLMFLPGGVPEPQTVARHYLEALLQTPQDMQRLRALAHLSATDDPDALIDKLSTRVALDFLHSRASQGAALDVSVTALQQLEAQRRVVTLTVIEQNQSHLNQGRRPFEIGLQQSENGEWRVTAVSVAD